MNPPKIYYAHYETLEYVGEGQADPDPLDSGQWLVPASAYLDAPPAQRKGYAIVRTADLSAWKYIEDNRGQVYDIATGVMREYWVVGPLPAGLTAQPYPGELFTWNGETWVLDEERQALRLTARAVRDEKLVIAALRIPPLQDAVDLCLAAEDELAQLLAWKRYRVALSRIELQRGFPETIDWPVSP
ncbi:tail fiber assembly protein [Pseudomonas sp. Je.1.5.c]|jgi:hypothetical protein|uniref:tail fiber assembly protein n=1 Tax=Pseudomonas sp. Je.1.5.c TaxID=3142839 RepID=UPI003DAA3645